MYHAPVPPRNTPLRGLPPPVKGGVPAVPATVTVPVTVTGGDKDDVRERDGTRHPRCAFTAGGHGRPRERLRAYGRYSGPGWRYEAAGGGTGARRGGTPAGAYTGAARSTRSAGRCKHGRDRVGSSDSGWRTDCRRRHGRGDGRGGGGARRAQATHREAKPHPARQPQRSAPKRCRLRTSGQVRGRSGLDRRTDPSIWQRQRGFDRVSIGRRWVRISTDLRIGPDPGSEQRIWIGRRWIWRIEAQRIWRIGLVDLARSGLDPARIWRVGRLDPARIGRSGGRIWASPPGQPPDPAAGSAEVRRSKRRIGPDPAADVQAGPTFRGSTGDRSEATGRTSRRLGQARRRHEATAARGDAKRAEGGSARYSANRSRHGSRVQLATGSRVASADSAHVGCRLARHRCRVDVLLEPGSRERLAERVERGWCRVAQAARSMGKEQQAR